MSKTFLIIVAAVIGLALILAAIAAIINKYVERSLKNGIDERTSLGNPSRGSDQ
ncbi:MAG: hypothetical protein K5768_04085 [Firmicutes bacterium]|nr:hypothetical protein [Bacillota bacterium]